MIATAGGGGGGGVYRLKMLSFFLTYAQTTVLQFVFNVQN